MKKKGSKKNIKTNINKKITIISIISTIILIISTFLLSFFIHKNALKKEEQKTLIIKDSITYEIGNKLPENKDFFTNYTDENIKEIKYYKDNQEVKTLNIGTYDVEIITDNKTYKTVIKVIDSSFIESRYKLVFGEEPTNTNLEDTCPHFVYSDKYKKYYINPYCGNTIVNESINQFAYDVKTDGEKFYVYVSVASYKQNEDNTYSVYRDPELKEKYQDFATEEEYSKFEVNNSNHNEFSKYKVTFVKVNDEYAFESFEKYTEEGSKGLDTKEQ